MQNVDQLELKLLADDEDDDNVDGDNIDLKICVGLWREI